MHKYKQLFYQAAIICIIAISFGSIFFLLQHQRVYRTTLAKISHNYKRTDETQGYKILWTKEPYVKISEYNSYNWDGKVYKELRDSLYSKSSLYHLAYYPLFPVLWKISGIDSNWIMVFNYLLFVMGLMIISFFLLEKNRNNLYLFSIALLMPSVIVYYLPYAESLFLFTFALAVLGLFKRKYWLYFLGTLAFSAVRPASQIFFFALIAVDFRNYFIHRNFVFFLKEFFLKITPPGLGIAIVILVQYHYSGSWTAYFEADKVWATRPGLFNPIRDWSYEGFGMTVFAIFFLALPAFFYAVKWGLKIFNKVRLAEPISVFAGDAAVIKEFLFNVSVFFTAGNLVYTFLHSGDEVNGFYRYTMSVPFFYILLFLLPEKINQFSLKTKMVAISVSIFLMMFFFSLVYYGESRFRFSYSGLYLSIVFLLFLIIQPYLVVKWKRIIFAALFFCAIIWHTYLFNMYLCNGWVYT